MREVARFGGDVSGLVHPAVADALQPAVRAMSFRAGAAAAGRGATAPDRLCPRAGDPRVRAAAERLRREGIAEPILIGAGRHRSGAATRGVPRVAQHLRERRPDRVHDAIHALDLARDPLRFAAALVALGEADGCVAGAVATTARRACAPRSGPSAPAPGVDTVSSAFYMVAARRRVLTFTDCAVVPEPTPEQLAEIALAAARDRRRLVGDEPRVAFLSYQHQGQRRGAPGRPGAGGGGAFPRSSPRTCRPTASCRATRPWSPRSPRGKAPGSPLGGRANVLVFPDLDAATSPTNWCSGWRGAAALGPDPAGPGPADERPLARGDFRMILSRWPRWWRCSAIAVLQP